MEAVSIVDATHEHGPQIIATAARNLEDVPMMETNAGHFPIYPCREKKSFECSERTSPRTLDKVFLVDPSRKISPSGLSFKMKRHNSFYPSVDRLSFPLHLSRAKRAASCPLFQHSDPNIIENIHKDRIKNWVSTVGRNFSNFNDIGQNLPCSYFAGTNTDFPIAEESGFRNNGELLINEITFIVPLDYSKEDGRKIRISAKRVVAKHLFDQKDFLPPLLFMQGGPGYAAPPPHIETNSWLIPLLSKYQIVLLDQRGTGNSTPIDIPALSELNVEDQYCYLTCFRADSIVKDCEIMRNVKWNGHQWTLLGQSFGGFVSVSYLSSFPNSISKMLITCGLPPITISSTDEVYIKCYQQLICENEKFYQRYPQNIGLVKRVIKYLDNIGGIRITDSNCSKINFFTDSIEEIPLLTVRRFLQLGILFGVDKGHEILNLMINSLFPHLCQSSDTDYPPSAGSLASLASDELCTLAVGVSSGSCTSTDSYDSVGIMDFEAKTQNAILDPVFSNEFFNLLNKVQDYELNPLYVLLHESIYCENGSISGWSAERVLLQFPEFDHICKINTPNSEENNDIQIYFTGEMIYSWMFNEYPKLRKLKEAAHRLAETRWTDKLYNVDTLKQNTVPVVALVNQNDMYVNHDFSRAAASLIQGARCWIANDLTHTAIKSHGEMVVTQLLSMAEE